MGRFASNREELQDALDALDLEWVLSAEGFDYKLSYGRSGQQLNLRRCPFCGTEEWKVYVGTESGMGNCFSGSCWKGTFNKWSMLRQIYELGNGDLAKRIKELVRQQGYKPKKEAPKPIDLSSLKLPESTPVADMDAVPEYLINRGITKPIAAHFGLRWSEKGSFSVKTQGGTITQDYSNRIIIPVWDIDGKLCSFQGRDVTGTAERRYLFPPMFASAGSMLYQAHQVGEGVDTLVISEGPFDVIGAHMALRSSTVFNNFAAVGTFGMHLSIGNLSGDDQGGRLLQLKRKGVKRVIFLWDGELKANLEAIVQAERLFSLGFQVMVAFLPPGRDPGDAGRDAILNALREARPFRNKLAALQLKSAAQKFYPASTN